MRRNAAGRWFVFNLVEEAIRPLHLTESAVGVDAGITALVARAAGEKITNPRHERTDRRKLAKAQRALGRTAKGSADRVQGPAQGRGNMLRNHSLARVISDASWRNLRSMLEYKARWYRRQAVVVDRSFPSFKLCSVWELFRAGRMSRLQLWLGRRG